MSWLVSAKQYIPAVIGEEFGGGYFAGYISHTADGSPTHALIVAPKATGATGTGYTLTTNLGWKTTNTGTAGTGSAFDGAANTAAMVTAGIADHPAANFCVNLSIGGFTDWYLPSRFEMDIAYFNLKPNTQANDTLWGINDYSVPKRTINNTATYPRQTTLTAFNTTSEAFAANNHWSSTEASVNGAWRLSFSSGGQVIASSATGPGKNNAAPVCAFRRIAL
jgi:hypothetical protein